MIDRKHCFMWFEFNEYGGFLKIANDNLIVRIVR